MVFWFDPIGNRTQIYLFSSRRFMYLTKIHLGFIFDNATLDFYGLYKRSQQNKRRFE